MYTETFDLGVARTDQVVIPSMNNPIARLIVQRLDPGAVVTLRIGATQPFPLTEQGQQLPFDPPPTDGVFVTNTATPGAFLVLGIEFQRPKYPVPVVPGRSGPGPVGRFVRELLRGFGLLVLGVTAAQTQVRTGYLDSIRATVRVNCVLGCAGGSDSLRVVAWIDSLRGGRLDSLRKVAILDSLRKVTVVDSLRAIGWLTAVDSLRKVVALDSVRKVLALDSLRKVTIVDSVRHVGRVDSVSLVHLGAADSVQLRTGTKHAGRLAVDSLIHPVYLDSVSLTHGGATDSVQLRAGTKHAGAVNVDSVQANFQHSDSCVTAIGAKSAADSVLLPARTALRHYLTYLSISRADSLTALAAGIPDTISTTNLPGPLLWKVGNVMAAGAAQTDLMIAFTWPIRAIAANTVTKIRGSAPGANVYWSISACYVLGP